MALCCDYGFYKNDRETGNFNKTIGSTDLQTTGPLKSSSSFVSASKGKVK